MIDWFAEMDRITRAYCVANGIKPPNSLVGMDGRRRQRLLTLLHALQAVSTDDLGADYPLVQHYELIARLRRLLGYGQTEREDSDDYREQDRQARDMGKTSEDERLDDQHREPYGNLKGK